MPDAAAAPKRETFGTLPDGRTVEAYTLTNARGMCARILTFGAILQTLEVPAADGTTADVVLGFDTLDAYRDDDSFQGAVVGRYANRIGGARFTLDGVAYHVTPNEGRNHLHGGVGIHARLWHAEPVDAGEGQAVRLTLTSPDGEDGFPGTLRMAVTYTLTPDDVLRVTYDGETDRATPVNLTQHAYFNLGGAGSGPITDHELTLHASAYTPVDASLIPTGELRPVAGTPFDFTTPHAIGARIDADDAQLRIGQGYDHNWVLDGPWRAGGLAHAARLRDPRSACVLDVHTTEPGIQVYTGNVLPDGTAGKHGRRYGRRGGVCLETQHFPDSPNQPAWPSTIVRPGEPYRSVTEFRFGAPNR